jgi:endo-1,4-beta-xylanase
LRETTFAGRLSPTLGIHPVDPAMRTPVALGLAAVLVATALAQPAAPTSPAPGQTAPPARGPKQFREPSWLMPPVEGQGLHYQTFESRTAGTRVSYLLYLPPGYETAPDRRYPVVYWLHGIGGSQVGVPAMAARHHEAIASGKTPPMLVVYVNGMIRSGYVDGQYPVETVAIRELIPHIDATYRTVATREGRMVEGFSMGGGGAAKWGFKYPELFGAVSILAGAMWDPAGPGRGARGGPPAAASTGEARPPDRPDDNPWRLVERNVERIRGRTAIRVVVGDQDGLLGTNRQFHEKLDALGLRHEFHVVPEASHSPNPLYDGLGEKNWTFYRAAWARATGGDKDGG